jgi:hypothetical protein
LDRQPERHLCRAVKHFEQAIASEATELATGPVPGDQFDPPIASATFGTGEIGFYQCKLPYQPIPVTPADQSCSVAERLKCKWMGIIFEKFLMQC